MKEQGMLLDPRRVLIGICGIMITIISMFGHAQQLQAQSMAMPHPYQGDIGQLLMQLPPNDLNEEYPTMWPLMPDEDKPGIFAMIRDALEFKVTESITTDPYKTSAHYFSPYSKVGMDKLVVYLWTQPIGSALKGNQQVDAPKKFRWFTYLSNTENIEENNEIQTLYQKTCEKAVPKDIGKPNHCNTKEGPTKLELTQVPPSLGLLILHYLNIRQDNSFYLDLELPEATEDKSFDDPNNTLEMLVEFSSYILLHQGLIEEFKRLYTDDVTIKAFLTSLDTLLLNSLSETQPATKLTQTTKNVGISDENPVSFNEENFINYYLGYKKIFLKLLGVKDLQQDAPTQVLTKLLENNSLKTGWFGIVVRVKQIGASGKAENIASIVNPLSNVVFTFNIAFASEKRRAELLVKNMWLKDGGFREIAAGSEELRLHQKVLFPNETDLINGDFLKFEVRHFDDLPQRVQNYVLLRSPSLKMPNGLEGRGTAIVRNLRNGKLFDQLKGITKDQSVDEFKAMWGTFIGGVTGKMKQNSGRSFNFAYVTTTAASISALGFLGLNIAASKLFEQVWFGMPELYKDPDLNLKLLQIPGKLKKDFPLGGVFAPQIEEKIIKSFTYFYQHSPVDFKMLLDSKPAARQVLRELIVNRNESLEQIARIFSADTSTDNIDGATEATAELALKSLESTLERTKSFLNEVGIDAQWVDARVGDLITNSVENDYDKLAESIGEVSDLHSMYEQAFKLYNWLSNYRDSNFVGNDVYEAIEKQFSGKFYWALKEAATANKEITPEKIYGAIEGVVKLLKSDTFDPVAIMEGDAEAVAALTESILEIKAIEDVAGGAEFTLPTDLSFANFDLDGDGIVSLGELLQVVSENLISS